MPRVANAQVLHVWLLRSILAPDRGHRVAFVSRAYAALSAGFWSIRQERKVTHKRLPRLSHVNKDTMALIPSLQLVATTLSVTALATTSASTRLDVPAPVAVITASGSASPSVSEVGDCVSFALDVTGTQDGIAIEPITAALTGPYDGWPPVGLVASAATVGSFSATWTGSEWSYDGDCVCVSTAGGYAWTLDNPNDPEGLDLIIHESSVVDVTEPAIIDPEEGGETEPSFNDEVEDGGTAIDVSPDQFDGSVETKRPQLAVTGANEDVLVAGATGGLLTIATGVALALRGRRSRARVEEAA